MTENIRRDMPAVADQLGLDYRYTELTPFSSLPQPPWDGPSRGVLYNRMHGTWRGHQVWIFDFEKYDTSERNTTREDIRTAICVASSFIRWPRTKISPYKNVDRIAGWFFPESTTAETFGSPPLHVVEGDVLDWPGLKDGRLKEFLQQHPDIEIRLGFGELSIFRVSRCLEASEVEDYLDTAEQLLLIVSTPPDRLVTGGRETQVGEFLVRSNRSRLAWIAGAMVSFFLLVFCCFHLWQAYRQWTATGFASTQGRVNLAAFDDTDPWIGMPANAMEFEYTVNGEVYRGNANDRRFVWRPLRRGDDAARQLSQSWRPGERPTVFYNLGAPHVAVLDNSFTTGDSGFVKLLLFVSGICLTCLAWPRLKQWWGHLHATLLVRSQPVEDVGRARCRLPLMPWTIDTIAVLVLPLSIYGLYWIASLVVEPVGIFATAGVWLKGAIVVNLCAIPVVYLLEKSSGGPGGRWLVADFATQTMSIPQARGPALEVPFGDIRSVRLRDNLRDFSTISIVCSTDAMLAYVDQRSGRTREIRIARCLTRRLAFQLATWLDSVGESGSQLPPAPDQPQVAEESPEGKPRTRFISDVKVEHLSYACLAFGGLVTLLLVTGFVIPAVVLLTLAAVSVLIVPLLLSRQASQ